jgi:hypothetical protein
MAEWPEWLFYVAVMAGMVIVLAIAVLLGFELVIDSWRP